MREKEFKVSDETRQRMSDAKKGKVFSEEHRKRLSEKQKRWWQTHTLTDEQRRARAQAISDGYRRKRGLKLKNENSLERLNWKAVEIHKPDLKEFVRKHGKLELF